MPLRLLQPVVAGRRSALRLEVPPAFSNGLMTRHLRFGKVLR